MLFWEYTIFFIKAWKIHEWLLINVKHGICMKLKLWPKSSIYASTKHIISMIFMYMLNLIQSSYISSLHILDIQNLSPYNNLHGSAKMLSQTYCLYYLRMYKLSRWQVRKATRYDNFSIAMSYHVAVPFHSCYYGDPETLVCWQNEVLNQLRCTILIINPVCCQVFSRPPWSLHLPIFSSVQQAWSN